MKTTGIAALSLCLLAGSALADIHETQNVAGTFESYGTEDYDDTNPLNQQFTVTFTGAGYTANGLYMQVDMTALAAGTYASEVVFTVTPPSGPVFYVVPAYDTDGYTSLTDVTLDIALPAAVGTTGTWTFKLWDSYPDGGEAAAQSSVSNIRVSLQDLALPTPPEATDMGTIGGDVVTTTVSDYVGGQIRWFKFTVPANATAGSEFYVDVDTVGTSTEPNTGATAVNDTELGLYDAHGFFYGSNDDGTEGYESVLTYGSTTARTHGTSTGIYDGYDGDMYAGTYYAAVGTYNMAFGDDYAVTSTSTSPGGSLVLNVFSNFPGGPAICSPADIGSQGGQAAPDRLLDNNDFVVFIDKFFAHDASADLGAQGGEHHGDSEWDNNDFVVFIDYFFNDAANCTG